MKRLLLLLVFLMVGMLNVNYTEAAKITKGNYQYKYESTKGGIWITKITPLSDEGISTLKIPKKIKGKSVVKLGASKDTMDSNWDDNWDVENIFGVKFAPDDIDYTYMPMEVYERTAKIQNIKIPSTVKEITRNCFTMIQNGKTINVPKCVVENLDIFTHYRWEKLTMSSKNKKFKKIRGCLLSKDGKVLYGFVEKRNKVVIPKTVKTIKTMGIYYHDVSTIVIPKSVTKIENEEMHIGSDSVVKVANGNKKYAAKNGTLYVKKTKKIVAMAVLDGVLEVLDGATYLTAGYRFAKPCANKLIIPASVRKIENLMDFSTKSELICVMKGKTPPKLSYPGINGVEKLTVYVPKGCKDTYEQAWEFSSYITVTYIEQE